jgi:predicted dehydrogenase
MTDRVLHWGLLSTAAINRALIPALRASSNNVLAGVASRDPVRADAYAREWKIPRAYGSYEAMLADPEIDAVYISLPNSLHAPWTIAAANAGKHVLCEKPLAIAVEEVDAMADAGQKAGVVIAEAFMYRHHPQTLKVKELLDEGAVARSGRSVGLSVFTSTARATCASSRSSAAAAFGTWDATPSATPAP